MSLGNNRMMNTVKIPRNIRPSTPTAIAQIKSSMKCVLSSSNSRRKSSPRFCSDDKHVAASVFAWLIKPAGLGSGSTGLFAIHQDADEQSDAKGDADGLIRMLANDLVGGLGAGDGFVLQFAGGF